MLLNARQIWPAQGASGHAAKTARPAGVDLNVDLHAGDRLAFVVSAGDAILYDTAEFDPTIRYVDGGRDGAHTASAGFSAEQGGNGGRYPYIRDGKFIDLVYYPGSNQWRKAQDTPTRTPFVDRRCPPRHRRGRRPRLDRRKAGRVRVTGVITNTAAPIRRDRKGDGPRFDGAPRKVGRGPLLELLRPGARRTGPRWAAAPGERARRPPGTDARTRTTATSPEFWRCARTAPRTLGRPRGAAAVVAARGRAGVAALGRPGRADSGGQR